MAKTKNQVLVTYVPVIHAGYLDFFEKYPAAEIVVLDRQLLKSEFRSLQKDIRALDAEQIVASLQTLLPQRKIRLVKTKAELKKLAGPEVILPEDEISQWLAKEYFAKSEIKTDTIFLRWSKSKTKQLQDIAPDEQVTTDEVHQKLVGQAVKASQVSPDWWRHTGALVARDGQPLIIGYNHHVPSDQQQYIFGDARANYGRGVAIELSTAYHSEEAVIAQAAAEGISLKGTDMYVTTFPCPFCARLVAYSGVKRLFYKDGYAVMDGADLMRAKGVELIKVDD